MKDREQERSYCVFISRIDDTLGSHMSDTESSFGNGVEVRWIERSERINRHGGEETKRSNTV